MEIILGILIFLDIVVTGYLIHQKTNAELDSRISNIEKIIWPQIIEQKKPNEITLQNGTKAHITEVDNTKNPFNLHKELNPEMYTNDYGIPKPEEIKVKKGKNPPIIPIEFKNDELNIMRETYKASGAPIEGKAYFSPQLEDKGSRIGKVFVSSDPISENYQIKTQEFDTEDGKLKITYEIERIYNESAPELKFPQPIETNDPLKSEIDYKGINPVSYDGLVKTADIPDNQVQSVYDGVRSAITHHDELTPTAEAKEFLASQMRFKDGYEYILALKGSETIVVKYNEEWETPALEILKTSGWSVVPADIGVWNINLYEAGRESKLFELNEETETFNPDE